MSWLCFEGVYDVLCEVGIVRDLVLEINWLLWLMDGGVDVVCILFFWCVLFDVIVVFMDFLVFGVLYILYDNGICVLEDVIVMGFDDVEFLWYIFFVLILVVFDWCVFVVVVLGLLELWMDDCFVFLWLFIFLYQLLECVSIEGRLVGYCF